MNLRMVQSLSKTAFKSVPIPIWRKTIPFVLNNMDIHPRRVMYLQALTNSLPERAQLIGQMALEGIPAALWDRLCVDVPAMIPRSLQGHWHLY